MSALMNYRAGALPAWSFANGQSLQPVPMSAACGPAADQIPTGDVVHTLCNSLCELLFRGDRPAIKRGKRSPFLRGDDAWI